MVIDNNQGPAYKQPYNSIKEWPCWAKILGYVLTIALLPLTIIIAIIAIIIEKLKN